MIIVRESKKSRTVSNGEMKIENVLEHWLMDYILTRSYISMYIWRPKIITIDIGALAFQTLLKFRLIGPSYTGQKCNFETTHLGKVKKCSFLFITFPAKLGQLYVLVKFDIYVCHVLHLCRSIVYFGHFFNYRSGTTLGRCFTTVKVLH
jgi:hypothetical protein